jgi:hypothetical protein
MRRYFILPVLGVCVLLLAWGSTALAGGGRTYYAGKNSQGQELLFRVDHTASGAKFDPLYINQISRCPATGEMFKTEFTFQGVRIPIRNGKFSLAMNDLSDRLRWNGTIKSKRAWGKESIDLAAFDNKGGLQDCGAGSLSWRANGLVPASSSAALAPSAAFVVKVTEASNGRIHFSITH